MDVSHKARDTEATIITALYDIKRQTAGDGRPFTDYFEWFEPFLTVQNPFVVFAEDQQVIEFISSARKQLPTIICEEPLAAMPYYGLKQQTEIVLQDPTYRSLVVDQKRVECNLALYPLMMYSKFDWVNRVAASNPFNTPYFFWGDAGSGRWSAGIEGQAWPCKSKLDSFLLGDTDRFVMQLSARLNHLPTGLNRTEILYGNKHYIVGTVLGGSPKATAWVAKEIRRLWLSEFLNATVVNDEQQALYLLALDHPEHFALVSGSCPANTGCRGKHGEHLTIFDHLSC